MKISPQMDLEQLAECMGHASLKQARHMREIICRHWTGYEVGDVPEPVWMAALEYAAEEAEYEE